MRLMDGLGPTLQCAVKKRLQLTYMHTHPSDGYPIPGIVEAIEFTLHGTSVVSESENSNTISLQQEDLELILASTLRSVSSVGGSYLEQMPGATSKLYDYSATPVHAVPNSRDDDPTILNEEAQLEEELARHEAALSAVQNELN